MTKALHLLKIDLKKMRNYRTFWVICGLYFLTLGTAAASGMEFLKWLDSWVDGFLDNFNVLLIPIYHFPDVWLNLIWCSGWLKIVLAIMVVISITNEFQYRTIRQNVIDGLSRWEFLLSKIYTNVLLSLMSVAMIFIIGLLTGLIYTPSIEAKYIFTDLEFFFAYFLEIFFFLSYALMLGMLINRSGLTIILLLLTQMIELIITANIQDDLPSIVPYFPMKSIWYLVKFPFPRYWLQEIQDYLVPTAVLTVIFWTFVFNYISYWRLKKADI
jgi:ABC-2 type transport system permease protein